MTKVIALSDTHLEGGLPQLLAKLAKGADLLLHAGDFVAEDVYDSLAELCRIEAVHGNADPTILKRLLPEKRMVEVEGARIGLIHRASLSSDPIGAGLLAREMDVDALVFGHLHRPFIEQSKRLLLCPGSPTVPRMSPPTVAELEIVDCKISGRILVLGEPSCGYLKYAERLAEKESQ